MSPFTFSTHETSFLRDGKPHRILSGALHYFRVPAEYWEDRLLKYKACGLNTVETYVAWNLHEPKKGEFCFEGMLDLQRFIQLAGSLGFDVILRPGPFICAEWEFGGFPAWLLADRDIRLRCMNETYLAHVASFFDRLLQEVVPQQCTHGGPVIAVQVENEYGAYGNDSTYLRWIETALRERGVDVLLFTSVGPEDHMLQGGTLPHLLKTVNFGSRAKQAFEKLREYQPDKPLMCMEFWVGWFDHWGAEHHTRDAQDAANTLDEILSCGASVNIYMMHGGTNFGFLNGANDHGNYQPTVTSYDYDSPLDEQGNPTRKYELFREVLEKHGGKVGPVPARTAARAFGPAQITGSAPVFGQLKNLGRLAKSTTPLTMEEAGQNYGYILYRTHVSGSLPEAKIFLQDVHDRALVYLDGKHLGTVHRNDTQAGISAAIPKEGATLEVLVENLGRVNYGTKLHDSKGITHGIRINGQFLYHWENYSLEFTDFSQVTWQAPEAFPTPTLHRYELEVDTPADTFLRVTHGQNGAVWINGIALGRHRAEGPQRTLFVPAPFLKTGRNTVIVLELEADAIPQVSFEEKAEL